MDDIRKMERILQLLIMAHTHIPYAYIYTLYIYLFVCLSVFLFFLSIYLSIHLSIYPSIYLSTYPIYLSIDLSIYLFVCLSVCLFVCLSGGLPDKSLIIMVHQVLDIVFERCGGRNGCRISAPRHDGFACQSCYILTR